MEGTDGHQVDGLLNRQGKVRETLASMHSLLTMVYRPKLCLWYHHKVESRLILFTKVKGISSDNEGIILIVTRTADLQGWHNFCLYKST